MAFGLFGKQDRALNRLRVVRPADRAAGTLTVARRSLALLREERLLPWVFVIGLAVVVTAVEAAGALVIFVLLSLVAGPSGPVELPVVGDVRAYQGGLDHETFVIVMAAGVVVLFAMRSVLLLLQVYVQGRLANNAGARLSVRLLDKYLSMPYTLHVRRNSAELIRNAYESVNAVTAEVIKPGVNLISNAVLAVGMLAVLFFAAPMATLLAIGFLGPLVLVLIHVIQPRMKSLGKKRQHMSKESLSILQQSLHGVREVKLFGRSPYFLDRFRRRQRTAARVSYLQRLMQELPPVLIETGLVVFIAAFLVITVITQQSPEGGLAVLGLFAYAALRLQPSVYKITQCINSLRFAGAAVDNIYDDLQVRSDREEPANRPGLADDRRLRDGVRLKDVAFRYTKDGSPVLQEINLTIRAGESVGFVGPTGGGKSTLLDLITGLLQPTTGVVEVDGVDLRRCTESWQQRLGVVSQTVFLLDDSVRRNIAFGLPDREIDDERVHEAMRLAQLASFVEQLPEGLSTPIGERGVRLSGGQRQRLAIARALYRDPAVLVFDEGTSALDNVTEAELISSLAALQQSRSKAQTMITVAHRLSTVRGCDVIYTVEGGRITDSGSFEELALRNQGFQPIHSPGGRRGA